jgi:hypothetical protein
VVNEREELANERDRVADEREDQANRREAEADRREYRLGVRRDAADARDAHAVDDDLVIDLSAEHAEDAPTGVSDQLAGEDRFDAALARESTATRRDAIRRSQQPPKR